MASSHKDNFDMETHVEIIKAYLADGMSHRAIQKEILGLPAPARGGGFITMNILHHYDIRDDKKNILKKASIDSEIRHASKEYKKALFLLNSFNEFEDKIIAKI